MDDKNVLSEAAYKSLPVAIAASGDADQFLSCEVRNVEVKLLPEWSL